MVLTERSHCDVTENGSFYGRSSEKEFWGVLSVRLACTGLYYLN